MASTRIVAFVGAVLLASSAHGALVPLVRLRTPADARSSVSRIRCSLFAETETRQEHMERVATMYDLDPDADAMEIAARAASSLPEEEDGNWGDVALCTLRNAAAVSALLAVVGALPGQASAASFASSTLVADAEMLDVVASIAVPLLVGGGLVAFAAANYEKLIDKLNDGR